MATITINATDEQIKAVNGIVIDHTVWLQAAFDGKASSSTTKVIENESNLNEKKMTGQEKSDWIRDNTFPSRVERDNAAGGNPPVNPGPPTP